MTNYFWIVFMKIVFSSKKKNPSALSELMEKKHIIEDILVIITSLWSTSFHLRIAKYEILTVSYYWEIWVRNNTLAAQLKKPHLLRPMPQWCHATKFRRMTNVVQKFFHCQMPVLTYALKLVFGSCSWRWEAEEKLKCAICLCWISAQWALCANLLAEVCIFFQSSLEQAIIFHSFPPNWRVVFHSPRWLTWCSHNFCVIFQFSPLNCWYMDDNLQVNNMKYVVFYAIYVQFYTCFVW